MHFAALSLLEPEQFKHTPVSGRHWMNDGGQVRRTFVLLFCRLLQGFSAGGEVGASTTLLAECAPNLRNLTRAR